MSFYVRYKYLNFKYIFLLSIYLKHLITKYIKDNESFNYEKDRKNKKYLKIIIYR